MKPVLLVLIPFGTAARAAIEERFEAVHALDAAARAAAFGRHGARLRAVLTNGTAGLTAAEIDACPDLGFVHVLGVGHENVDTGHARARGIAVSTGAGTNADAVADHAFALLLASVRRLPYYDRAVRDGQFRTTLPIPPAVSRRRLGLLGFGEIGARIARRGVAFDMEVGFHTRRRRDDTSYRWFDSVLPLATWCDFLVVATPGGADTTHLVDAAVLEALGPAGWLVNIARGSVVDTQALAAALRDGRIAGAGLDVYESEPAPPVELLGLDDVLVTPHVAGTSPESTRAMLERFLENADCFIEGRPLSTPL